MPRRRIFLPVAFALAALTLLTFTPARAADLLYIVDSLDDTNVDSKCTLREAITAANGGAALDCGPASFGADAIEFGVSGQIVLGSALPAINDDLSIDGGTSISLSGNNAVRILTINSTKTLALKNITLTKGHATSDGGAINNLGTLNINNVKFPDNHTDDAHRGGAIYSQGPLTITNSEFDNNSAQRGGAIYASSSVTISGSNLHNNHATSQNTSVTTGGGALWINGGTATIQSSTFSGNITDDDGGGIDISSAATASLTNVTLNGNSAKDGGGIYNDGKATLTNSTLSGNSAGVCGGGVFNDDDTLTMTNVTLSGNSAGVCGGGLTSQSSSSAQLFLTNVIVANSPTGGNCNFPRPPDGSQFNLSDDGTCKFGRDNVNIKLGPLANNGGSTQTHLPQAGSPAIDGGTNSGCPSTDQRGVHRPQGLVCDVGSVEVVPAPATATPTPTKTPTATPTTACLTKPAKPTLRKPSNNANLATTPPTLKWNAANCAQTYKAVVKDALTGKLADKKGGLQVLKYKTDPLPLGKTYKWFVKACNPNGCAKSTARFFTLQ